MVCITTIDFPDGRGIRILRRTAHVLDDGGTAMELNEYLLEILVRERLADARAATARRSLVVRSRRPRSSLRTRVGAVLIALGERLTGAPAARPSCATGTASRG
jgi:hypothetical protein